MLTKFMQASNKAFEARLERLEKEFSGFSAEVRKTLKSIEDNEIKSARRLQDLLYNLDDDNVPTITVIREDVKENNTSLTSIKQTVDGQEARIESIAKKADDASESVASIKQTVYGQESRIDLVVASSGNGNNVVRADIIMKAINNDTSSIKIKADKIQLEGDVEAKALTIKDTSGGTLFDARGNAVQIGGFTVNNSALYSNTSGELGNTMEEGVVISTGGISVVSSSLDKYVMFGSGGVTLSGTIYASNGLIGGYSIGNNGISKKITTDDGVLETSLSTDGFHNTLTYEPNPETGISVVDSVSIAKGRIDLISEHYSSFITGRNMYIYQIECAELKPDSLYLNGEFVEVDNDGYLYVAK